MARFQQTSGGYIDQLAVISWGLFIHTSVRQNSLRVSACQLHGVVTILAGEKQIRFLITVFVDYGTHSNYYNDYYVKCKLTMVPIKSKTQVLYTWPNSNVTVT